MAYNFYRTSTGAISNESTLLEAPFPSEAIKRESNYKVQDLNDIITYIDELSDDLERDIKRNRNKPMTPSKNVKFYLNGVKHLAEKI